MSVSCIFLKECNTCLEDEQALYNQIDEIYYMTQDKAIRNPDIGIIDQLKAIELTCEELLEVRNTIMKYGDYNIQKDLRNQEQVLEKDRKARKTQKKRDDEYAEKIQRQIKNNERVEKQKKIKV